MKERGKIIDRYSLAVLVVLAFAALICFVLICIHVKATYAGTGMPDIANTVIGYAGLAFSVFIVLLSMLFILLEKHHIRETGKKIDVAFNAEKTFINNASHELNNPLTAIQGECEITLLKERTPAEYQVTLVRIASETKRIIQLIRDLLFLSQGKEEILNNVVEPIPLGEFLMQSFSQNRVSFSADQFAYTVNANPNLLKIALGNIIHNALKYSDNKPVYLRLRSNILYIDDEGIGIPEDDLRNIAQPFYRASNTGEYKGHGVGLSLSIQILNTYGAKITISSEENEGTHFRIEFP